MFNVFHCNKKGAVVNAAKAIAFFACALFCMITLSCGGGGGGGGASLGGSSSFGTKTLSIDINGLMGGARASARPNLDWNKIELTVYVNDEVVYDESIPKGNNDVIRIENVKIGAEAYAKAKVYVDYWGEEEEREAVSDTITVQTGTNKLTLYVPYKVTYDLGNDDYELRQSWDDGTTDRKWVTATKPEMKAPQIVIGDDFGHWKFAGWTTQPRGEGEAFVPGVTTGDKEVFAYYIASNIVYDQAYYTNHPGEEYEVNNATQFMQIAELSRTTGFDFADRTVKLTTDITLDASFMGLGTRTQPFKGTFDGQLHTVTVSINSNETAVGFVNALEVNGTVKNLYIAGSVTGGSSSLYVGGVVGCNDGIVTQCAITDAGTVITAYGGQGVSVGGIVGSNNGTINKAYATGGTVSIQNGGAAGNCVCLGGISGDNYGVLKNVFNSGCAVNAKQYTYAGGILGYLGTGPFVVLTCCYANDSVTPTDGNSTTSYPVCGYSAMNEDDPDFVPTACFHNDSESGDAFSGTLGKLSAGGSELLTAEGAEGWRSEGGVYILEFEL